MVQGLLEVVFKGKGRYGVGAQEGGFFGRKALPCKGIVKP